MNPRRTLVRTLIQGSLAAAIICAAAGNAGGTVFKNVDAEGHTTYTDRPDVFVPALTEAKPAGVTQGEVARALASRTRIATRSSATIDANEASLRLVRAQLDLDRGAGALHGEQIEGAETGEAYARYWRRQKQLSLVVEKAQRRVDETRLAQAARR
jgi:hypothetical protein